MAPHSRRHCTATTINRIPVVGPSARRISGEVLNFGNTRPLVTALPRALRHDLPHVRREEEAEPAPPGRHGAPGRYGTGGRTNVASVIQCALVVGSSGRGRWCVWRRPSSQSPCPHHQLGGSHCGDRNEDGHKRVPDHAEHCSRADRAIGHHNGGSSRRRLIDRVPKTPLEIGLTITAQNPPKFALANCARKE